MNGEIPMEKKVLTVVIPSYNTSDYIDQCIGSFAEIDTDKLEVLIVDDGSKDDTFDKAQYYEQKYPNMIKAIHKENGGHGSTINIGLQYATGKYFRVIDGDDWVDSKALAEELDNLESIDCDMALTNIVQVYPDKELDQTFFKTLERNKIYDIDDLPEIDFLTLGSIAVKTDILKNNGLKLTEKCFYEDIEFCTFCLSYAQNMIIYDLPIYMYRLGNANQSVAKANMVKNIAMLKKISLGLLPFYERNKPKSDNSRKQLLLLRIGKIVRTTMLLHLANANSETGYDKWRSYAKKVRNESPDVFEYIRKKWLVIRMLCSGKRLVFNVMSKLYRHKFSIN